MSTQYQTQPIQSSATDASGEVMEFRNVTFGYDPATPILQNISLKFMKGKTYALVGPTGGGKSTTASLMARLYDPQNGTVELFNKDIRTYSFAEVANHVGFILQEPFLFTGTVYDNIVYGNPDLDTISADELVKLLHTKNVAHLLDSFEDGVNMPVQARGQGLSLGQQQLVSFIRAVLRNPSLLILDEATANIDTITESVLEKIIQQLPEDTTKIIIAHRLHTVKKADEIIFISNGQAEKAVLFDELDNKFAAGGA